MSGESSSFSNEHSLGDTVVGYICLFISVILFGSNYIVTKKYPVGDGFYFTFMMGLGVMVVGVFVMLIRGTFHQGPIFLEPFSMIGGLLWATGNLTSVPIIQCIGLSLGPSIWGIFNMITGWVTGTFGLFGLNADKDDINIFWLNCIGALLAGCSVPCYAMIKVKSKKESQEEKINIKYKKIEESPLVQTNDEFVEELNHHSKDGDDDETPISKTIEHLPKWTKMILGIVLAIIAGIMYGSNFDTPNYLRNNGLASPDGIDYVFPQYIGVFLGSATYFMMYAIIFRNQPFIYNQTAIPGLISGAMWGIAQALLFIANTSLPYVVVYPIVTTGPGLVSSLWGILVFREIRGIKNFIFFGCGTLVLFSGLICIICSR
ncbi:transmembrane protein R144.6, putative [Entamoeba dispar SAW760]|uniref:Transmembrane protein R144.6, putative n=1 Tax=Entamoeba dispar (strain ATCC PRA-260 / SAW760) TaxID=370354 RepID=B0EDQ7_ENTDS|nr:transmembrane protein R144.6, putative [Entamoeba dispar SAW760]EDR27339.1 transmembrane protein R144.6, putative [Entamoeba dispar SAW760]|eukprot:EDR27339.1 transmembrane protein R144.6, putative [Entamoeba dispar SAW760]